MLTYKGFKAKIKTIDSSAYFVEHDDSRLWLKNYKGETLVRVSKKHQYAIDTDWERGNTSGEIFNLALELAATPIEKRRNDVHHAIQEETLLCEIDNITNRLLSEWYSEMLLELQINHPLAQYKEKKKLLMDLEKSIDEMKNLALIKEYKKACLSPMASEKRKEIEREAEKRGVKLCQWL